MLAQQFVDLFPVLSDAHSELTWYWKYLSVPTRNGCGGIVDGENVHLPVIGDLFHLPDPSLDDKVQAYMGHREHELFAEDSNRLLVGQINHLIPSLVRNHAQVLVVVHPSPRCPVERLIVSFEMPHFPHELDNLLQLSLFKLRIGKRSPQNFFDVAERDAAF